MPPLTLREADAGRLGWAWLLTGWLVLSAAGSKLFTYALPLFPAVALLATVAWSSRGDNAAHGHRWFDRVVVAQAVVCALLLPLALAAVPLEMPVAVPRWAWACAAAIVAGWLWTARAWTRGDRASATAMAPLLGAAIVAVILTGVMPRVGEALSARDLAGELNRSGSLPAEVWVLRQRLGSIVFYLAPPLRAQASPERIRLVQLSDLRSRRAPEGALVAVAAQDQARLDPFVTSGAPFRQAGRYRVYRAEDLGVATR
jgi:hypothetical protein